MGISEWLKVHDWVWQSYDKFSAYIIKHSWVDSLVAKPWSRLPSSLVAQTFNGVTDKKSSLILIYENKSEVIYTGMNSVN